MAEELVALAGDLVAERKRLSEGLRRLEGSLLRGEPAKALSGALGLDGIENLQTQLDQLAMGVERLGLLASTLAQNVQQENEVSAETLLRELAAAVELTADRLARPVVVNAKAGEVMITSSFVQRFGNILCRMAETLVEFSIESERERTLRGKRQKARFQIEIKELEDSYRLMLVCDGNGIIPPLVDQHGVELAKAGGRAGFDGSPGKWSAWCYFLPREMTSQRCVRVRSDELRLYVPAWALVDVRQDGEERLPLASGESEGAVRKLWKLNHEITRVEAAEPQNHPLGWAGAVFADIGAGTEIASFKFDDLGEPEEVFMKPLDPSLSARGRFTGVVVNGSELTLVLNPAYLVYGEVGLT